MVPSSVLHRHRCGSLFWPCRKVSIESGVVLFGAQAVVSVMMNLSVMFLSSYDCLAMSCLALPGAHTNSFIIRLRIDTHRKPTSCVAVATSPSSHPDPT